MNDLERAALRHKIAVFVQKSMPDGAPLPLPDAGDCWFCLVHAPDGRSLGEISGDEEHLRAHVEEDYLPGALIANALRFRGFSEAIIDAYFAGMLQYEVPRHALQTYLNAKLLGDQ